MIRPDWSSDKLDLTKLYTELIRRWDVRHLFHVYINEDRMNSTRNIITVRSGDCSVECIGNKGLSHSLGSRYS